MVEELETSRDRQKSVDEQHLKLLSVFHFVGAGLAGLGIAFVALHYALFSTVMDVAARQGTSAAPPPAEFFALFRWVYVVLGLMYGSSLVLNLLAGGYLRARRHRIFCIVVASLNCLHMPLGTILGIFTIVVLIRDSVRESFDRVPSAGARLD